jgi:hypothetical protein
MDKPIKASARWCRICTLYVGESAQIFFRYPPKFQEVRRVPCRAEPPRPAAIALKKMKHFYHSSRGAKRGGEGAFVLSLCDSSILY